MFATLLTVLLVYCSFPAAHGIQGCSSLPDSTQIPGLISSNYQGNGQGTPPTITLQTSPLGYSYRIVCTSSSGVRNQYRFVSIVAYYTSTTSGVTSGPMYGQFEFECVNSAWTAISTLLDNTLFDRTILTLSDPAVNISTMRTDCAYCLNTLPSPPRQSDSVYHCSPCSAGCSQPALCYTMDTSAAPSTTYFSQTCCNYFLQTGVCTTSCPQFSFPDANRTCIPCTLNCQNGGTRRLDVCGCNCNATYGGANCSMCLCQNGGTCTGSGSACNCPPGYTGTICETQCPQNCDTCSSSSSCSGCHVGYLLNATSGACMIAVSPVPPTRPACSPGCIAGIVVGIVILIVIIVAIAVVVAAGVYKSTNAKITLTKPQTDKDVIVKTNDLYISPEDAVKAAEPEDTDKVV